MVLHQLASAMGDASYSKEFNDLSDESWNGNAKTKQSLFEKLSKDIKEVILASVSSTHSPPKDARCHSLIYRRSKNTQGAKPSKISKLIRQHLL